MVVSHHPVGIWLRISLRSKVIVHDEADVMRSLIQIVQANAVAAEGARVSSGGRTARAADSDCFPNCSWARMALQRSPEPVVPMP